MLAIQSYTFTTIVNKVASNTSKTGSNLTSLLTTVNQSNQTLFNILLPVFSAWVGVVIAFYFGSKQAEIAQETLAKTISSEEEKLVTLTVQALLDKYPETQNPKKVTLTDTISDVLATFSSASTLTDVLVVDKDDKPIGILYKSELLSVLDKLSTKNELSNPEEGKPQLYTMLGLINHHLLIPEKKWMFNGKEVTEPTSAPPAEPTSAPPAENSSIANFATVIPDDNLYRARERMINVSKQINDVRCVVIVDEASKKVRGIFGYDSILAFIRS